MDEYGRIIDRKGVIAARLVGSGKEQFETC
jgi:hypothetical protein